MPSRVTPLRVFLVEDLPEHHALIELQLSTFERPAELVGWATTLRDALDRLEEGTDGIDVVVSDLSLADADEIDTVTSLREAAPTMTLVVMTSAREYGLAAMRAGAQEYLVKGDTSAVELERAIGQAMARQELTNELYATTREVERLVYSFTHDLRSPLSVATGFMTLMREHGIPDDLEPMMAPLERSLYRIDAITADLMQYAKSVHGALELDEVDLGMMVRSAAVDLAVPDVVHVGDLPTVIGDRRLLRNAIDNLLGNAVKYAHPDRPIRVDVTAADRRWGWQVNVDDNGMGMSPGSGERVFDMFVRGVDEQEIEGTGIGLAIVRRAIERHRGRIWWEPNPSGTGTRFAFLLPPLSPDDIEDVPAVELPPSLRGPSSTDGADRVA